MLDKETATARALEFLRAHQTGTIATASLDGRPFASTIYFSFQDDFTLFFATSHKSAKFSNLTLNNRVSFSCGVGPEYQELVVHGTAFLLTEPSEVQHRLAELKSRVENPSTEWPIHAVKKLAEGGDAVYRITPEEVLFLDLTSEDQMDSASKYFYRLYP